ncbi:MAG: hypothetical protein Q9227_007296 [Pyrenula ochraceoflavens]
MHYSTLIVLSSLAASAVARPPRQYAGSARATSQCQGGYNPPPCFTDGNTFPPKDKWPDFETLWSCHLNNINEVDSTTNIPYNFPNETAAIKAQLQAVSTTAGTDPRFALAIMMRESIGHTDVGCADQSSGYPACGLFQNKDGKNPNVAVPDCSTTPECPLDKITAMITCGVAGCGGDVKGDWMNVKLAYNKYPEQWGPMARMYNSGSVPNPNNLTQVPIENGQPAGIPYYAQDIGNLIMGHSTDETFGEGSACQGPSQRRLRLH